MNAGGLENIGDKFAAECDTSRNRAGDLSDRNAGIDSVANDAHEGREDEIGETSNVDMRVPYVGGDPLP